MAKKVSKKGEAPRVETITAAQPTREVKLEWKVTKYDNGLVEWRQTKAIPESRDLSIHTYNERDGWAVSCESSMSTSYGFKTPEAAMRECEEVVRFRLTPKTAARSHRRTPTAGGSNA